MSIDSYLTLVELTPAELYIYDGGRSAKEIGHDIGEALGTAARAVCDFCDGFVQGFKDGFLK